MYAAKLAILAHTNKNILHKQHCYYVNSWCILGKKIHTGVDDVEFPDAGRMRVWHIHMAGVLWYCNAIRRRRRLTNKTNMDMSTHSCFGKTVKHGYMARKKLEQLKMLSSWKWLGNSTVQCFDLPTMPLSGWQIGHLACKIFFFETPRNRVILNNASDYQTNGL